VLSVSKLAVESSYSNPGPLSYTQRSENKYLGLIAGKGKGRTAWEDNKGETVLEVMRSDRAETRRRFVTASDTVLTARQLPGPLHSWFSASRII
jgi:hypothetical protein